MYNSILPCWKVLILFLGENWAAGTELYEWNFGRCCNGLETVFFFQQRRYKLCCRTEGRKRVRKTWTREHLHREEEARLCCSNLILMRVVSVVTVWLISFRKRKQSSHVKQNFLGAGTKWSFYDLCLVADWLKLYHTLGCFRRAFSYLFHLVSSKIRALCFLSSTRSPFSHRTCRVSVISEMNCQIWVCLSDFSWRQWGVLHQLVSVGNTD